MKLQSSILLLAAAATMSVCTLSSCKKEAAAPAKKVVVVEEEEPAAPANCLPDGTYQAKGSFNGKSPFTMHFAVRDNKVAGSYYYDRFKSPILIIGEISPEGIKIQEYTDGKNTGDFKGVVNPDREYTGTFNNHFNGKSLAFQVNIQDDPEPELTIDQYFFAVEGLSPYGTSQSFASNDDGYGDSGSSGSSDWDALIDSYERYMDKAIQCYRKAANGDMTAMAEYTDLLGEAQELSDRIQRAQNDMSPQQVARFTKVVKEKSAEISRLK